MMNLVAIRRSRTDSELQALPDVVSRSLMTKMRSIVLRLERHIKEDKLSGQVLNVQTGALRRSITSETIRVGQTIVGRVFSSGDVKYAAIHEFGGVTKAHIIEPRKGEALMFMMGGSPVFARVVNHPGSRIPERSYMRSSLADMRDGFVQEIRELLSRIGKTRSEQFS